MKKKIIHFSLGELFVIKMMGKGGYSIYHETFGNMNHPIGQLYRLFYFKGNKHENTSM